jgi:hypothetical protein
MKLSKRLALCSTLLLTASLAARADEPKPALFANASIVSLNDAKKLVADLGIPLPGDPTAMLENMFPFIGPGGLQTDKPVGVLFVAGEHITTQDLAVIALPVVPGKATIAALAQTGGQPVANHPDMTTMGGQATFRRTANYLMFYSGAPDILAAAADDPFTRGYNSPGRIALLNVNLAAARAAAPSQYKSFLEKAAAENPASTDAAQAVGQKYGESVVRGFTDKLEHLSLAVSRDQQNLHLETWLRPCDVTGSRKFPRPAFPADTVAQMHVAYPDAESAKWVDHIFELLPSDDLAKKHSNYTPEMAARAKALALRAIDLLCDADAQSFAVSVKAGKPVLYVVNQYSNDRDFAGEVKAILADGEKLDKETGETDSPKASTYQTAGGKPVTRISFQEKGKQQGYVDFIQTGHVVTLAIASDEGKYVEPVAALPANGEMSALCSGSIDLAASLKASQDSGKSPLPPEQLKDLTTAFAGQSITWNVKTNAQSKDLYVDLAIPFSVIQQAAKMYMTFAAPHAAPPPATVSPTQQ